MRFWVPILILAMLAGCGADRQSARYRFGVSGDRLASATIPANNEAMRRFLDAKARQICTLGYSVVKVDTMAAENGRQIVDLDVRCNPYRPDFALDPSAIGQNF